MSALAKGSIIFLFIQLSPQPLDTETVQRIYPFLPHVTQVLDFSGFKGLLFLMLNQKEPFFRFWESKQTLEK